jgi:exosortase
VPGARARGDLAAATAGLAVLALAMLYTPVVQRLITVWTDVPYYSYGILVPLFSAYLAWEARRALTTAPPAWRIEGLLVLAGALGLLEVGAALGSFVLQVLSLPVALTGLSLFVLGRERTRVLGFPLGFLALMAPLPDGVIPALSLPLQHLAARFAHATLVLLGIPVTASGLFLHLRGVTLHVTEQCNGLRFLLAMVVIGIAYAWTTQSRGRHRALVIAGAITLAILGNMVRVAGTAILAHLYGPETAVGFFHATYGKVIYGLTLVPFLALVFALRRRDRTSRSPGGEPLTPLGGPMRAIVTTDR